MNRPLFDPIPYEYPAWPDCPACDGRGWYGALNLAGEIVDRRCQCWVWQLALNGPPE